MKRLLIAAVLLGSTAVGSLHAAEISPDGQHLLAYGRIGVLIGLCKLPATQAQLGRAQASMDRYADSQTDFKTPEEFNAQLKDMATAMVPTHEEICQAASQKGVDGLLDDADSAN